MSSFYEKINLLITSNNWKDFVSEVKKDPLAVKELIKEKFSLNSFVKIKDNTISIVVSASEHNTEKANSIIRSVQELYDTEMYITVKFNK